MKRLACFWKDVNELCSFEIKKQNEKRQKKRERMLKNII